MPRYVHYYFYPSPLAVILSEEAMLIQMASRRVVLILGAGPRVGQSVAEQFSQNGYEVAMVGRSLPSGVSTEGYLNLQADLSDPDAIPSIFSAVQVQFGVPNIVVYNGQLPSIPLEALQNNRRLSRTARSTTHLDSSR